MLISIIVPIYNAEKYLEKCLESIKSQTIENIEVILVDDGSKDESSKICLKYMELDKRFRLIMISNGGVSRARNIGLDSARGEYIIFIDSDDYISNIYCEKLLGLITKHDDIDIALCGYYQVYNDKKIYKRSRLTDGIYKSKEILGKIVDDGKMSGFLIGSVCAAIYKYSIIANNDIRFRENISANEDGIFNLLYCLKSKSILADQSFPLYYYRIHGQSSSHKIQYINKIYNADIEIEKIGKANDIPQFSEQMKKRYVSERLWEIMSLKGGKTDIKRIETICADKKLKKCLKYVNIKNMSIYKKVYYYLIKFRLFYILYFLSKYMLPLLESRLNR